MAARQQPLRPPSSSTMVVRIRTVDGSMRRVSLLTSKTAPASTNINDTNETAVPPSAETTTLSAILALAGVTHQLGSEDDNTINDTHSIQLGSNTTVLNLTSDGNKTMTELGLVHGSILTVLKPPPSKVASSNNNKKKNEEDEGRFDPFPELATSSSSTTSATSSSLSRRRRENTNSQSKKQNKLHVIEPQSSADSTTRVYVCEASAAKFRNHCITTTTTTTTRQKTKTIMENRVGLLFGTIENNNANYGIHRRRTTTTGKRGRTSISESDKLISSSSKSSDEIIVKVHAIWEPTNQKPSSNQYTDHYDDECLLLPSTTTTIKDEEEVEKEVNILRAIRIGRWLGLRPVGWIFSYTNNDRTKEVDNNNNSRGTTTATSTSTALPPIYVRDVIMGSKLQIQTMKYNRMLNHHHDDDDDNGRKDFVTLAMNCVDGMTESFQFSNVCVQMVAEGVLSLPVQLPPQRDDGNTRLAKLLTPVLVSDEETTILDTVLLLINLAMFSHVGFYSGNAPSATSTGGSSVKRSTGELLTKTRKRILKLLVLLDTKKKQQQQQQQQQLENDDKDVVDGELLKLLCDFDILLALDALLDRHDSEKLCLLVKQYATTVKNKKTSMKNKKKKQPIVLDEQLRLTLESVLDNGF